MTKDFFKPEDFEKAKGPGEAVELANKMLHAEIEKWPIVHKDSECGGHWLELSRRSDTHRAHLAFIEEIPKAPCLHPNKEFIRKSYDPIAWCKDCGVELVAVWKEKK